MQITIAQLEIHEAIRKHITSIVHVNLAMAAYLITADYHETVTVHGGDPNDIWAGPGFLGCEWDLGCAGFGTIAAPFDPQNMQLRSGSVADPPACAAACCLAFDSPEAQ